MAPGLLSERDIPPGKVATMPDQREYRSLAVTLALAFIALSLVVIIISSSLQAYANYQNQQKVIADEQKLVAQGAAGTVRAFFEQKFNLLEASASFSDLAGPVQQRTALEKLLHLEPAFRQVIVMDTRGGITTSVSRQASITPAELVGKYRDEILTHTVRKETYISPVYIDPASSEPLVVMAVPVTDVFGDYKGILAAEVNLKFLWDLVGSLKIGESGDAYVVDGQGNLIAFSDISRVLRGENERSLQEVQQFISSRGAPPVYGAEVSKGILGTDVVANYEPLGTPDWAVFVEVPAGEAYRQVTEGLIRTALILIVSLVLAAVMGMFIATRITRPLVLLRDATREIGRGNLDARVEVGSRSEIGELAVSFNKMTEDLRNTTVSKNYVDDILRSMFDMLIVVRPDSVIRSVNKSTCDGLSYREDELIGEPFEKILADKSSQPGRAWIDELVIKGTSRDTEITFATKDGKAIPVVFSASVMRDTAGTVRGIVCIAHDITRRKQAEEALKAANDELEKRVRERTAQLTRVNRELEAEITEHKRAETEIIRKQEELSAANEELTATEEELRHNFEELNRSQQALAQARSKLNILNTVTFQDIQSAVFTLSGYLAIEENRTTDEQYRQYLAKQAKIIRIISESLIFANRYQNLGLNPPRWQNVLQVFLLGISHLDLSALSRRLAVDGLEIYADTQLENVFFTLAENVLLHGKTATELSLSYREGPGGLTIIFEDNGEGVRSKFKETIFHRLYEDKKGMGLFLTREILGITGITIEETGEPGKGARFEMLIPKGMYRFEN